MIEYTHTGGRCSVTGGYVYRGPSGTFGGGTYLYADFCTGEIFTSTGGSQSVLLDMAHTISSFGEDQAGEIYVVNYSGGAIGKLTRSAPPPPCTFSISPTRRSFGRTGGTGAIAVTAGANCTWTASSNASWITVTGGTPGNGNGVVTYSIAPYTAKPKRRQGTIAIAGQTFTVTQTK